MANSTIKFWQEMRRVPVISSEDKILLGINNDGSANYTNFSDLKNAIGAVSGANFAPPVDPGGTLVDPGSPSFTFLSPGDYVTSTGVISVPENDLGVPYFDGIEWSLSTIPMPGITAINSLDSTDTHDSLSANQGRILNEIKENVDNKKDVINDSSLEYPSSKAVLTLVDEVGSTKENAANKKDVVNYSSTEFPSSKAVADFTTDAISIKEDSANKSAIVRQSLTEFPTSNAVVTYTSQRLQEYQQVSNKRNVITVWDNNQYYPTNLAVVNYVDARTKNFSDTKFGGTIDDTTDLSNPTEKVWYYAQAGTYNTTPPTTLTADLSVLSWDGERWTSATIDTEIEITGPARAQDIFNN